MNRGAIVLAGGKNSRMGREKWLLKVAGRTVIERIVDMLGSHVGRVVIVLEHGDAGKDDRLLLPESIVRSEKVVIVRDEQPAEGPLAGIEMGLRTSVCDYNFTVASDMPFLAWGVAEKLFAICEREGADGAVPSWFGRQHPLCAVYHQRTLGALEAYRRSGGAKVMEWVNRLQVIEVSEEELQGIDPDGKSFYNMNTPDDYQEAIRIVDTD